MPPGNQAIMVEKTERRRQTSGAGTARAGQARQNDAAYRAIFDASPVGQVMVDGGQITGANPGAGKALGCDPGSLSGTALDRFCPDAQPDGESSHIALETLFNRAASEGTASRPWRFVMAKGGSFDTLLLVSRLPEGVGVPFLLSFLPCPAPGLEAVSPSLIEVLRDALHDLAAGELDAPGFCRAVRAEGSPPDGDAVGDVRRLLALCGERLAALSGETGRLAAEAIEGQLATRGDPAAHPGVYGRVLGDVNLVLESIGEPVTIAGRFIDDLSHGRRLAPIQGEYRGEFEALVRRLNRCFDTYVAVHSETGRLAEAAVRGELGERIDDARFEGSWKGLVQGMNGTLDAVVGPLQVAEHFVDRIAHGDIPDPITEEFNGDFNDLKNNLNTCIENITTLVEDTRLLADAGIAGSLATRADPERLHGEYRRIVEGMNALLDAVAGPVNMASRFIEDLSHGRRLKAVSGEYRGEFAAMSDNIDRAIETYIAVHTETNRLTEGAANGDLGVRIDPAGFEGSWKALVQGMNDTLDAVVVPLQVAERSIDRIARGDIPDQITEEYRGDFKELIDNLNACIANVNALIEDSLALSRSAIAGQLDTRADPSRHQGDFRRIVEGVNATLDAMIGPVYEAMRVSQEYAACNFSARVDPSLEAKGDFVAFCDALNAIGTQLEASFQEISRVADAYARGDFSTGVDPALDVKGDLVALCESLDRIGVEVSRTLGLVNRQVVDLSRHAGQAREGVEVVGHGANEIARSAESVSRNAEQSENGIEQVLQTMEDLTRTVGDVSSTAESVARLTAEANSLAKRGIEAAEKAEKGMDSITGSSAQVDAIIHDIREQMGQIGKIVGLITDIANQTNLLALNAAIEAARAGDAGRGFAVVAAEVKSLAQESRASAETIAGMIGGLNAKSEEAADAMNLAGSAVQQGNLALEETLKVFSALSDSVESISRDMTSVSSATEEQAASFEEITASVNEMAGLLKLTARDAEHSSSASEEALASVRQVTEVIREIDEVAAHVDREMGRFSIRAG